VFFYFFVAGIATVMLGPLLPSLIARWHIQDAQAGTLFTASFAGQLCGAWIATHNLRASVLYGAFVTAIGCAFMAAADFEAARIALFCIGLGLGAGLTAGNVIVGTVLPMACTRLLALLNVAWGAGAIACTLLVRACGAERVHIFFLVLSGCLALGAIFALAIPRTRSNTVSAPVLLEPPTHNRLPLPVLPLLMFAAAVILYVGIENTLGGWLPSYAVRVAPTLLASSIALYFWGAEVGGRLLLAALTNLFGEAALYRVSVATLLLTTGTLIFATRLGAGGIITLTVLSGLALAPVYPLILSFLLARTGNHPKLGPLFASASLGGAALPWLTGYVSLRFHDLRGGFVVPVTGAVILLILSPAIARKHIASAWKETAST
jgi:fucose permease